MMRKIIRVCDELSNYICSQKFTKNAYKSALPWIIGKD